MSLLLYHLLSNTGATYVWTIWLAKHHLKNYELLSRFEDMSFNVGEGEPYYTPVYGSILYILKSIKSSLWLKLWLVYHEPARGTTFQISMFYKAAKPAMKDLKNLFA